MASTYSRRGCKLTLFGVQVALTLVTSDAIAHSRGLDANGCHHDRKRGGYHCHRAQPASPPTEPGTRAEGTVHYSSEPSEVVRSFQELLKAMNYYDGRIDGLEGGEIKTAVIDYQFNNDLPINGGMSRSLLEHVRRSHSQGHRFERPNFEPVGPVSQVVNQPDNNLTQTAQQLLNELGFDCGEPNGIVGGQTVGAVLDYQFAHGLETTGDIDEALIEHLRKQVELRR